MFSKLGGACRAHFLLRGRNGRKGPNIRLACYPKWTPGSTPCGEETMLNLLPLRKEMESDIDDIAKVPMCESNADDDSRLWIERTD